MDYLEKNEFITCLSPNTKRYKSPLVLTEKGSSVGKKIADKIDGVLDQISVGLTEKERQSFYRYLSIISNSLEVIANKEGE